MVNGYVQMRLRRRRRKFVILVVIGFVICLGLFDLSMFWLAHREKSQLPNEKADWVLSAQVHEPKAGPATRGTAILLHGFVGSPYDFFPLVGPLTEIGYRVIVPIVPEQNRKHPAWRRGEMTPDAMVQWVQDLVEEETLSTGRPPTLVGFSMGASLALLAAHSGGVNRLVLLAPYFGMPVADKALTWAARVARWVVPIIPKSSRGQIRDPEGYSRYEPGSFLISLPAFLHLQRLAEKARSAAPYIRVPTITIHAPKDSVASFYAMERLLGQLANVEIVTVNSSNHILLFDFDAPEVIRNVVAFLNRP